MIRKIVLLSLMFCIVLFVFPATTFAAQKRIEVNLTQQRLYAYEDNQLMHVFPVSTGKIATPTPTGSFWPWIKLRYTRMQGGSKAAGTYYNLPNVPYVIYLFNARYPKWMGYGLHGTYWHNNFGHPMSHGCINLRTSDMAQLYYWIDLVQYDANGNGSGTIVTIVGNTPRW